jgi:hypothetical protein
LNPQITWVKTKRLKPFAYSTKNLAQELRFELRMLVLETRVLPVTPSLLVRAAAGFVACFREAVPALTKL